MLTLERFNVSRHDQWTDAIGSVVQQPSTIHPAGFATKLPRFNPVGPCEAERARFFSFEFGTQYRVRRYVHLSSRVAVHQQHINVQWTDRADGSFMYQLKSRKRMRRPCRGVLRRNQQRAIHKSCLRGLLSNN